MDLSSIITYSRRHHLGFVSLVLLWTSSSCVLVSPSNVSHTTTEHSVKGQRWIRTVTTDWISLHQSRSCAHRSEHLNNYSFRKYMDTFLKTLAMRWSLWLHRDYWNKTSKKFMWIGFIQLLRTSLIFTKVFHLHL